MGWESSVYGVIHCFVGREVGRDSDELNLQALRSLPQQDDFPFLVRSMFATTTSEYVSIEYKARLIHFAASYKEVDPFWREWIEKFERFLSNIDGTTARVHLDTVLWGSHVYEWRRSGESRHQWPPVWVFQGGPLEIPEPLDGRPPRPNV